MHWRITAVELLSGAYLAQQSGDDGTKEEGEAHGYAKDAEALGSVVEGADISDVGVACRVEARTRAADGSREEERPHGHSEHWCRSEGGRVYAEAHLHIIDTKQS